MLTGQVTLLPEGATAAPGCSQCNDRPLLISARTCGQRQMSVGGSHGPRFVRERFRQTPRGSAHGRHRASPLIADQTVMAAIRQNR